MTTDRPTRRSRRRACATAGAVLLGVGLVIAGAAGSGSSAPEPAVPSNTSTSSRLEPQAATGGGVEHNAVSSTDGPTHFDTKTGTSERPTPLPVVYRTYGEGAYGSGRYGR